MLMSFSSTRSSVGGAVSWPCAPVLPMRCWRCRVAAVTPLIGRLSPAALLPAARLRLAAGGMLRHGGAGSRGRLRRGGCRVADWLRLGGLRSPARRVAACRAAALAGAVRAADSAAAASATRSRLSPRAASLRLRRRLLRQFRRLRCSLSRAGFIGGLSFGGSRGGYCCVLDFRYRLPNFPHSPAGDGRERQRLCPVPCGWRQAALFVDCCFSTCRSSWRPPGIDGYGTRATLQFQILLHPSAAGSSIRKESSRVSVLQQVRFDQLLPRACSSSGTRAYPYPGRSTKYKSLVDPVEIDQSACSRVWCW